MIHVDPDPIDYAAIYPQPNEFITVNGRRGVILWVNYITPHMLPWSIDILFTDTETEENYFIKDLPLGALNA